MMKAMVGSTVTFALMQRYGMTTSAVSCNTTLHAPYNSFIYVHAM